MAVKAAKTGLNDLGAKRWFSVKWIGKIAESEKFVDSYLQGTYGTAMQIAAMSMEQKCILLQEAIINHMNSKVAGVCQAKVNNAHALTLQAAIDAELATVAVVSED